MASSFTSSIGSRYKVPRSNVSKLLDRVHCISLFWRSRAVTSLKQVYPIITRLRLFDWCSCSVYLLLLQVPLHNQLAVTSQDRLSSQVAIIEDAGLIKNTGSTESHPHFFCMIQIIKATHIILFGCTGANDLKCVSKYVSYTIPCLHNASPLISP